MSKKTAHMVYGCPFVHKIYQTYTYTYRVAHANLPAGICFKILANLQILNSHRHSNSTCAINKDYHFFFFFLDEPTAHKRVITKEDDIFAFGTLIFEIFGGFLPFPGIPASEICKEIRCGRIDDQLKNFPGKTEKLKRVIQACWHYKPNQRIALSKLVANFTPGNCLVRRHSTSEPQLDQILSKLKK